jgi:hypothetical protein
MHAPARREGELKVNRVPTPGSDRRQAPLSRSGFESLPARQTASWIFGSWTTPMRALPVVRRRADGRHGCGGEPRGHGPARNSPPHPSRAAVTAAGAPRPERMVAFTRPTDHASARQLR